MKKLLFVLLSVVSIAVLAACGPKEKSYYFATTEPTPDSSWVYYVVITKEGDEITEAVWDAYSVQGDTIAAGGRTKYQASVDGLYVMSSDTTKLKWHEQADLITNKLIETQSVNEREPIPAGATITTDDFYTLAEKALASDPIPAGEYVDGYHFLTNKDIATDKDFGKVYDAKNQKVINIGTEKTYSFGSVLVVNGTIVMSYFNCVHHGYRLQFDADGKKVVQEVDGAKIAVMAEGSKLYKTKNELGVSYVMKKPNGPGSFEYYEASATIAKYLVENQALPALNDADGFDDVAGVTIKTSEIVTLVNKLAKK